MSDLLSILDAMSDDMAKDFPHMSETEIAFSVIRINLTVLTNTLCQIGMTGEDLANESLYGMTAGLVETLQWMAAKELNTQVMSDIEQELS